MYAIHCTVCHAMYINHIYFVHTFYIYQIITDFLESGCIMYNIMLQNEEVCGNTICSSSGASGENHIIHRSRRLR